MESSLPSTFTKHTLTSATRVLLADDDPDMRAYVASPLRRLGYQVIEVSDGTELLEYLHSRFRSQRAPRRNLLAPCLMIVDIKMPGCDGLSVVTSMRRWGWNIPVILISAVNDDFVYQEASRLRVSAYFQKPFDVHQLCTSVEAMLAEVNVPEAPVPLPSVD